MPILRVNTRSRVAERERALALREFGLDERDLQGILFEQLDRLLPDDELLLLSQSRQWQEEPDLLAVGADGTLYIFELKVWEARTENLLQALRYGQLFGSYGYGDLDRIFRRTRGPEQSLKAVHEATFGLALPEEGFNRRQVFVVMTNGLDVKTRQAVRYWTRAGLDVRPWVYRAYRGANQDDLFLELVPFRVADNPAEDVVQGHYLLNTNASNDLTDDADMLANRKAAAYFDPWKRTIERLTISARGDPSSAATSPRSPHHHVRDGEFPEVHCPNMRSSSLFLASASVVVPRS